MTLKKLLASLREPLDPRHVDKDWREDAVRVTEDALERIAALEHAITATGEEREQRIAKYRQKWQTPLADQA